MTGVEHIDKRLTLMYRYPILLDKQQEIADCQTDTIDTKVRMSGVALNWVRLALNGTNLGIFKISFSTFWLIKSKRTESDLKKSQICHIWGQSDQILCQHLHN